MPFYIGPQKWWLENYGPHPSVVETGLVLHLDAGNPASYSGTGSTWYDLSGLGNDITLYNSPTYDPSNGGVLIFNGVNNYGERANHSVTPNGGMTLCSWVNVNTSLLSESAILNHYGYGYLNIIFTYSSGNKFRFECSGQQLFTNIEPLNIWFNFVGVIDNQNEIRIYLNGQLVDSISTGTNLTSTINSTLYVGYDSHEYFPSMKISNIMEYNRPLTQQEITQNYNALKGRYGL